MKRLRSQVETHPVTLHFKSSELRFAFLKTRSCTSKRTTLYYKLCVLYILEPNLQAMQLELQQNYSN